MFTRFNSLYYHPPDTVGRKSTKKLCNLSPGNVKSKLRLSLAR